MIPQLALAAALSLCAAPEAASPRVLDEEALLRRALVVAPEAAAVRASLAAASGRLRAAGAPPPAELALDLEEVALDRPGLAESEITLSWSRPLEPLHRRALRRSVAEAEERKTLSEARGRLLTLLATVTREHLELRAARERADVVRLECDLARELRDVAHRRVRAGASAGLEEDRAALDLEAALVECRRAEDEVRGVAARLAARLDLDADELLSAPMPDEIPPPVISEGTMDPELEAAREAAAAERARHALATAEARPLWSLTWGLRHLREDATDSFVLGTSVPLGTRRLARGTLEATMAEARRLEAEARATERAVELRMATARATDERLHSELAALDERLLPRAERLFDAVSEAYRRGELSYPDLLEARRTLVAARRRRLAVAIEHRAAAADLAQACGGSNLHRRLIEEVLR